MDYELSLLQSQIIYVSKRKIITFKTNGKKCHKYLNIIILTKNMYVSTMQQPIFQVEKSIIAIKTTQSGF